MRQLFQIVSYGCLGFLTMLNAQESENFELLNGDWSQACDSVIQGTFQGEIDCNPEIWTQVSFKFDKNKGTMTREDFIIKEKDTSHILFEKIGGELYMIGSTDNKPWLRKVHEIKDRRIGLYSNFNTTITFYVK